MFDHLQVIINQDYWVLADEDGNRICAQCHKGAGEVLYCEYCDGAVHLPRCTAFPHKLCKDCYNETD